MDINLQNTGSRRVSAVLLVIFLICSIVAVSLYAREDENGPLHTLQDGFHSIISPLEAVGSGAGAAIDSAQQGLGDSGASEETLSALRERVSELTALVAETEEYRQEVQRLEELLNVADAYGIDGVTGHIIGKSTDAWNQTVTLDVGASDGVETGLTVVGSTGVIGQVISTSGGSCVVRLLSDPNSGAAAILQSSRTEGVVRGSLSGVLYLENVDSTVTVSPGDVVLTSGLGGSYTRGLLIGVVARVDGSASDGTRRISLSLNESAYSLEEVTVVFSSASDNSASASTTVDNSLGSSSAAATSAG